MSNMTASPATASSPTYSAKRITALRRMLGMSLSWRHPLSSTEGIMDSLVRVLSLWAICAANEVALTWPWLALSGLVAVVSFPAPAYLRASVGFLVRNVLFGWLVLITVLGGLAWLLQLFPYFNRAVLCSWVWIAPSLQLLVHFALRGLAPALASNETERAVIAGASESGAALAIQLAGNPYSNIEVVGFFDDRNPDRLTGSVEVPLIGRLGELTAYVTAGNASAVYIALPMAAQSRISGLIQALRALDVDVYFVPDNLMADLLRGRRDLVGDKPVVAILEAPFDGAGGFVKRVLDVSLAGLLFVLTLPLLLILALLVKLNHKDSVFVKQSRFGLDGERIELYALRTADGNAEAELAPNMDDATTTIGAFILRYQLEKLPRLFNVLQGRLSLVGPRPHAREHNEIYRRIVKGHLVRHRVLCGITGWAQINGIRGGNKALEHMKARIQYDFEYVRNWSLRLDLQIMLRALMNLLDRDE